MSYTSVRVLGPLLQCFGNGSFVENFAYGPYICNLSTSGSADNVSEFTQRDGREKRTAKRLCVTNVTELLLACYVVILI